MNMNMNTYIYFFTFLKLIQFRVFKLIITLTVCIPFLLIAKEKWTAVKEVSPGTWGTNIGAEFPGAKAQALPLTKASDGIMPEAAVEVDLRGGGRYAGLQYPLKTANADRIRFEVLGENIPALSVRIIDANGQAHVTTIELKSGIRQLINLPLNEKGFPGHWGGMNDGKFYFPITQLLIVAERIPQKIGSFRIYNAQINCETKLQAEKSEKVWLQIASGSSNKWRLNLGLEFPGANAEMKRIELPDDKTAVAVDVNFSSGGRYAGLEHPLELQSATELQLAVASKDINGLSIRIEDSDGQFHVTTVPVPPNETQLITLPVDNSGFPGHWGGQNDGIFRFPLKKILIVADSLPEKHGSFQVESIRVAVNPQKLSSELSCKFDIVSNCPGNIYFHDGKSRPEIKIINLLNLPPKNTTIEWKITDHLGKTLSSGKEDVSPDAYETVKIFPTFNNPDYGYYRLSASLLQNNQKPKTAEMFFAVVKRLPNYGPAKDTESFFGLQLGDIFDPAAAARIGVKWDRPTRVWLAKEAILSGQPSGYDRPYLAIKNKTSEEDKYFWPDDTAIREGQKYGISSMMTLHYEPNGCMPMSPGDTGFPPSAKQLQKWEEFVSACVKRYDNHVAAWEIMNEAENTTYIMKNVSLSTGIQSYCSLIRSAKKAILKNGSRHPIVAIDITSGDNTNATSFAEGVTAKVGNLINIFTGHPYAYPRYFGPGKHPVFPLQSRMREKILEGQKRMRKYGQGNKPLWIGEIGWGVDNRVPIDSSYTRAFASCVAQGLILIRSVPGVQRCIWFIQDGCNEGGYEYGLWRGNPFMGIPLQPLPAAVAYASCARFLYKVTPARELLLSGMNGYAFLGEKRDRVVVALWSAEDDGSAEIDLPVPPSTTIHSMYGRIISPDKIKLSSEPVFITAPYNTASKLFAALEKIRPTLSSTVRIQAIYFSKKDKIMVRLKNRTATPQLVEVSAMGQKLKHELKKGETVTLGLQLPSTPSTAPEITLKVAGKTVEKIYPSIKFASCPYRQPEFNGNLVAWGKPQAILKSRLDILPPDLNIGWGGPKDLSAEAWWGWNDNGFCFAARISDDTHKIENMLTPDRFWLGDSLQLAFDVKNDASVNAVEFTDDDRELGLSTSDDGGKIFSTFPSAETKTMRHSFKRIGNSTIYEVLIPWEMLGVNNPEPGQIIGFNFIANDNDGNGRKCWIGLSPGIGEYKRPGCYLKIRLDKE
ncbi:MAG: hypothetical protein JXR78_05510 [Victivallales bacterium]|nr:hypothetical protein [Victivallales bacterium]